MSVRKIKLKLAAPVAVATTLVAIILPLSAAQTQSPAGIQGPLSAPADPLGSSAQESARAAVEGTIAWVNQYIGPLNPDVANAINTGIQTVTTPIINALP